MPKATIDELMTTARAIYAALHDNALCEVEIRCESSWRATVHQGGYRGVYAHGETAEDAAKGLVARLRDLATARLVILEEEVRRLRLAAAFELLEDVTRARDEARAAPYPVAAPAKVA